MAKLTLAKVATSDLATLQTALNEAHNAALKTQIQARIDELEAAADADRKRGEPVDEPVDEVKLPKISLQKGGSLPATATAYGLCSVMSSKFQGVVEGQYGPQWHFRLEVLNGSAQVGWVSQWLPEGQLPGSTVNLELGSEANDGRFWSRVRKSNVRTDDASFEAAQRLNRVAQLGFQNAKAAAEAELAGLNLQKARKEAAL